MKSEFILAFNEICESRGLPKEDVFEALKTALVSAYRRDMNISSNQDVTAEIDPRTGEPTILSEKEVVEDVMDDRTEVLLSVARAEGHTDAELGDVVMVDSTTPSFGRIAAQTAKQVLLQRVREAEREHLFEDFSGREGELVNGTVQSISGQHVTIGLGRTEAIMPKSQQVPGERARAHDKIRVYVLEVRRTSRGPQIVVSRNHRNLLRRLLELEVPEIYNGQVEIKSIAREAGQRSKVAVQALQPGVDPVGACVGMRGVRIQSIVRELNDEKIDVIEWDPDQRIFIAKALSPARVSHVFLEEDSEEGKTAVVIVPDDQLSLAIGREGQNARLAAKLTGWRIDIKSLTEAATESLNSLDDPAADPNIVLDTVFLDQVRLILDKKETGRPVTAEDYMALDKLVAGVEGRIVAQRAKEYEDVRRQRMEQRKNVPDAAWSMPLDDLDLPGRIHNLLLDASVETVGDLMFVLEMGDETFLSLRGLGDQSLETVRETLEAFAPQLEAATAELERQAAEEAAALEAATPIVQEVEVEEDTIVFGEDTLMIGIDADEVALSDDLDEAQAMAEAATEAVVEERGYNEVVDESETVVAVVPEATVETELELEDNALAQAEAEAEEVPAGEVEPEPEPEPVSPLDDLSKSLIEPEAPAPKAKQPEVVIVTPSSSDDDDDDDDAKRKKRKGRALVYDEDLDQVVIKRKRKKGRSRPEWEDIDIDDVIDDVIEPTVDEAEDASSE